MEEGVAVFFNSRREHTERKSDLTKLYLWTAL
jgi:hypothetical protein